MHRSRCVALFALSMSLLALAGCRRQDSAVPAQPMRAEATATTTFGGVTLQASTLDIADLNDTVARRYAVDHSSTGVLLLVTVRDADGNGVDVGDLHLDATAAALPDGLESFAMHPVTIDGMTDYIGVFKASPPATVHFRVSAVRNGSRADISTTAELYPR